MSPEEFSAFDECAQSEVEGTIMVANQQATIDELVAALREIAATTDYSHPRVLVGIAQQALLKVLA